jgi:transposase-like protein
MMNFRELVEKGPDADLLREMIGFAAERLMQLEVGAVTGAAYAEKDPARRALRNGYRDRDWETRSVDDLVKAMGMSGISKSQVSRL